MTTTTTTTTVQQRKLGIHVLIESFHWTGHTFGFRLTVQHLESFLGLVKCAFDSVNQKLQKL